MGNFLNRLFGKSQLPKEIAFLTVEVTEEKPRPVIVSVEEHEKPTTIQPDTKVVQDQEPATVEVGHSSLPSYESTLNLEDYRYPLLESLDETLKKVFGRLIDTSMELPLVWSVNTNDIQIRNLADLQTILVAGPPSSGKTNLL